MKCIDKKKTILVAFCAAAALCSGCAMQNKKMITEYEASNYNRVIYEGELFANQLCVGNGKSSPDKLENVESANLHALGLFDLTSQDITYSEALYERLYPASTTKILTAYVALKHGTLSDVVTVSREAVSVPSDSSKAGLRLGDQLTLKDLLYGLMLPSGNDSAIAIAEHISGNVDAFVALMNQEAKALGATHSHFMNPHGYQDSRHYTTAYDLYLIFNQAIKMSEFQEIVSSASHRVNIKQADGTMRDVTWKQSNQFVNGMRKVPEQVTVIGGKTGTTDEAGACLVLLSMSSDQKPFISIIMGAESKPVLYDSMTSLISTIPGLKK